MLHILLLILKILGWILLAILGVIVLLICIVIFTPLRYELKGKCDGTLKSLDGGVTFSYFFHLISGSVRYADEQVSWKLRIAWKRLGGEETAEEIENAVSDEVVQAAETVTESVESATEAVEETAENTAENSETVNEKETAEAEDDAETVTENETIFPATDLTAEENEEKAKWKSKASDADDKKDFRRKKTGQKNLNRKEPQKTVTQENLIDKLDKIIQKIACKFTAICDKIKELIRKKEIVIDFLTNEIHTAAFKRVISELKRLMRKLKPKKLNGNLEFGFEDPALTGKVLAGISMLYPYLADNAEVNPRFEEKILKGDIYIKGSVAARLFASMGLRLLLDKNIRTTIRHVKKFKL